MSTDNIIVLSAFAVYLIIMIVIGFIYSKSTKNNEDYFLGGQNLGGWTAALSAQASDMSGWLLMGLPGSIYLAGTGEVWIAVGLLIGTILNWYIVSARLRKYTIAAGNSLTIPSFFQNRYRDTRGVIKIAPALSSSLRYFQTEAEKTATSTRFTSLDFALRHSLFLSILLWAASRRFAQRTSFRVCLCS